MEKSNQIYMNIIDSKVFPYILEEKNKLENESLNNFNLIKALCILSFDDEIGQIAETFWPQNSLDKTHLKQLSGLGFPQTNSLSDDGEMKYIFKIRKSKFFIYL